MAFNIEKEIQACLRNAGIKLMEDDSQKTTSYEHMDEIDDLMDQYERAHEDYRIADFYDDNYSWRTAQDSASSRMSKIQKRLKELTGKGYDELFKELGSKEVDIDRQPKFQNGTKVIKMGELYEIVGVKKYEHKSRASHNVSYCYQVKNLDDGSIDEYCFEDYLEKPDEKYTEFRLATNKDIEAYKKGKEALKQAIENSSIKVNDTVMHKSGHYEFPFKVEKIVPRFKNREKTDIVLYYYVKDESGFQMLFSSDNMKGWSLPKK